MVEPIDLLEHGFVFAIEAPDARFGVVEATYTFWDGETGEKTKSEIELVPCESIGNMELTNEYSQRRSITSKSRSEQFLCPSDEANLSVQGDYSMKDFSYIKVSLKPCDLRTT